MILVFHPKDTIFEGAKILESVLLPMGFQFRFRGEGRASGGDFAWGEFVREDRKLELHFRHSLGLVRYHVGDQSASHEPYMRELGVWEQCRYPGFSENAADSFYDLAHDVGLAEDFLSGSAVSLRKAATNEERDTVARNEDLMVRYSGDSRTREQLCSRFQEKRYRDVVALAKQLKYPDRITESERQMIDIARKRTVG